MRNGLLTIFFSIICHAQIFAQNDTVFTRTIYNSDYDLYIKMNFTDKNVTLKHQEFMGEMAGYMGDYKDFRTWLIVDAEITSPTTATLQMCNDECSEDLEATLTLQENGTYKLHQGEGSTLKVARNRKWQKLPKELTFTTKRMVKKEKKK